MRIRRHLALLAACLLAAPAISGLCGCGSGAEGASLDISVTEVTNNVLPGGAARWRIQVDRTNSNLTELTYSVEGLPVGATTNLPITRSQPLFGGVPDQDMTVAVPGGLATGTYRLTIVVSEDDASGFHATDSVDVNLVVRGPAAENDFDLSVSPAAVTFNTPGQSRVFTYTVTPKNGWTGTVSIQVANLGGEGADLVLSAGPSPQPLNVTGNEPVSGTFRLTYQPVGPVRSPVNVLIYGNSEVQAVMVATLVPPPS
jgi:hypothetical protein